MNEIHDVDLLSLLLANFFVTYGFFVTNIIHRQFIKAISFGKEWKKFGIACPHPKLIVLHRDNSIRAIVTSANFGQTVYNITLSHG